MKTYCLDIKVAGQVAVLLCASSACLELEYEAPNLNSRAVLKPAQVSDDLRFDRISAGDVHTCGVTTAGEVYCWGDGGFSRLGDGREQSSVTPVAVASAGVFTTVSAGSQHTCALTAEGEAYCWGWGKYGALGIDVPGDDATFTVPVLVTDGIRFQDVSAGSNTTCALTIDGQAYCWGMNLNGEVGTDAPDLECGGGFPCFYSPQPVATEVVFTQLGLARRDAYAHTCGLSEAGPTLCWGSGSGGNLGDGPAEDSCDLDSPCSRTPVLASEQVLERLAIGSLLTIGLTADGRMHCIGNDVNCASVPADVAPAFVEVVIGGIHTCGLTAEGVAHCWGANDHGQLGSGDRVHSGVPVPVATSVRFASLSAGQDHTCGISVDGIAYCWGLSESGQTGSRGSEAQTDR